LYYLRKGDKDRKWLLGDMMFPDPFKTALDQEKIRNVESMAKIYFGEEEEEGADDSRTISETGNDNFFDADDENPEWFQKKFPHLK
jgi:hypothetical protein